MTQLIDLLDRWKEEPSFMANVTRWEVLPALEGDYRDFPFSLDRRLQAALRKRGITQLYSHQAEALQTVQRGEHVVVVTPPLQAKPSAIICR